MQIDFVVTPEDMALVLNAIASITNDRQEACLILTAMMIKLAMDGGFSDEKIIEDFAKAVRSVRFEHAN